MPETEIFLKQVAQQRIDLFVSGFFDVVQDLSLIEGRPFPSEVYATSGFQEKFKQRYGKATVMKGPNAYDVVKLLALAIEKTGEIKPKPLSIKRQLLKIRDYPGAVGSVSIDECGNSSYPIVTKIVTNGKLEVLGG